MDPVKVGILGLGTVGGGTVNVLRRNAEEIARRAGRGIKIVQAAVRDSSKPRICDTAGIEITDDPMAVIENREIEIVIELIGGDKLAKELVLHAIKKGKHVVTANKALIAKHGNEIFTAAHDKGVTVAYEAAVAGGIPIIKAIREGLTANVINSVTGIINGTGNFILTEMRDKGRDFDDVLKEAQELGYAEADPTFDVEGIDAAHKLTILAAISFGIPLQFEKTFTEGISGITKVDVEYAEELGYRIKHLGIACRTKKGYELRVHPTLIPERHLLASVNGVMNAVLVDSDAVGQTMYYGAGAGDEPTASAVVADVVDIVRSLKMDKRSKVPHLGFQAEEISDELPILNISDVKTAYYLRMHTVDRAGVLAEVTKILGDNSISIEALVQKELAVDGNPVPIVALTHVTTESNIDDAISKIENLDVVADKVVKIRVESLGTR